MRRLLAVLAALALPLGACKIQETGRADSMAADSIAAIELRRTEEVRLAIDVARRLRAAPEDPEAILRENDLTRAGLDSLLYRIAGDASASAAYDRGMAAGNEGEVH